MKSSDTLYRSHRSIRKEPVNLVKEDLKLFEHEFSVDINETKVVEFENANILKDTIFIGSNLKFHKSFSHIYQLPNKKLVKKILLFFLPYRKIEKGIWVTDERSPEYFHWLTDALPRLIAVEESKGKNTVILPASYQHKSYVGQSLELLNINCFYYNRSFRLAVAHLYTANHTALSGNYNTTIINKLRDRFIRGREAISKRKIFISRQKAPKRQIANEQEIIPVLLDYGYEIHCFEEYDLKDQVRIMSETRYLIGLHGAGLTNMLFMKSGGNILELRNEGDTHNNCYFSMASALNHDYFYLLNAGNTENTNEVDVIVDVQQLEQTIRLMEKK